jgi:hypothetical protein
MSATPHTNIRVVIGLNFFQKCSRNDGDDSIKGTHEDLVDSSKLTGSRHGHVSAVIRHT